MASVSSRPDESADDGDETNLGLVEIADTRILLSNLTYGGGIRIPNIAIAQGVQIDSAILNMKLGAKLCLAAGNCNNSIRGDDVDNAAVFSAGLTSDISDRWDAGTTAAVAWNETDNAAPDGFASANVNVTTIVQELLDRPGWSSGNAMAFPIKTGGYGRSTKLEVITWDDGSPSGNRATLTITFTEDNRTHVAVY